MFAQLGYYICIPFAWLTRLFYSVTGSYGVALILFTLVVKLVILPFQLKSKKSMLRMNRMQGKIKDIQTRYASNKQKQQEEMANLYAQEGINPMSGCLWSFLPFPILIALYYIIRMPLRYFMSLKEEVVTAITTFAGTVGYTGVDKSQAAYEQIYLAKFIHENWDKFEGKFPGLLDLDYNFLGIDLSVTGKSAFAGFSGDKWTAIGVGIIIVLAAGLQLLMSVISMRQQGNTTQGSAKTMMYMMPLMTLWFGYILPASLAIYWAANAGFSCIQEIVLNNYFSKRLDAEETEKERAKREKRIAKMKANQARMAELQNAQRSKPAQKKPVEKEPEKKIAGTNENGRVGQRPYARGRAFSEDHYND